VAILLNENRFESSLEEMAHLAMAFVVGLRVYPIELPHSFGQVSIRRFNDQMIAIVHQAVGMTDPVKALSDVSKRIQKKFAIAVILEDGFAIFSAGCDMIKRTVVFNS
jgi:hypothetical protein